jgi:DNA-binding response OmpR family regulator
MSQRIAIVEDEPSISQLYEMKFKKLGYEVRTAMNGQIGLALVEQFRPHLILLDLLMPEMTGEEMLEAMRATDWGKNRTDSQSGS